MQGILWFKKVIYHTLHFAYGRYRFATRGDSIGIEEELFQYQSNGVHVMINGEPIEVHKMNTICSVLEESTYMRDFQYDEYGIKGINFDILN